ncbi:MAG: M23 family metallopeptidase [Anaerolineae bacterium]|nr:M23 family metallopeptidase [Anaerolineae bacterium]
MSVDKIPPYRLCLNWLNVRRQWAQVILRSLMGRSLLHLVVLLLIVVVLEGRAWVLPQYAISVRLGDPTAAPTTPPRANTDVTRSTRGGVRQSILPAASDEPSPSPQAVVLRQMQDLLQSPVPHTIILERQRREVITYTVSAGDNVSTIASQFGLRPDTLIWANAELEDAPDLLYIGQVLIILPIDGVYHTVAAGDTLEAIADKFKVDVAAITGCAYNGFEFEPYQISPGQTLIVPGGVKPFKPRYVHKVTITVPDNAARGAGSFIWPVGGYISQGFWEFHKAIDIAGAHGDIVVAADSGYVVYASWDSTGYGNLVAIDHGNGFVTYYAHLYGFTVDVGQSVQRGQQIGARGSTGRSTGSHLHFEVRYNGVLRNPISFLPGQ